MPSLPLSYLYHISSLISFSYTSSIECTECGLLSKPCIFSFNPEGFRFQLQRVDLRVPASIVSSKFVWVCHIPPYSQSAQNWPWCVSHKSGLRERCAILALCVTKHTVMDRSIRVLDTFSMHHPTRSCFGTAICLSAPKRLYPPLFLLFKTGSEAWVHNQKTLICTSPLQKLMFIHLGCFWGRLCSQRSDFSGELMCVDKFTQTLTFNWWTLTCLIPFFYSHLSRTFF